MIVLLPGVRRLVNAYLETVLSTVDWGGGVSKEETVADVIAHVRELPAAVGMPLQSGWLFFENAPRATRTSIRSFSRLAIPERRRVLAAIEERPGMLFTGLLEALQTFCLIALGARPEVLRALGVNRQSWVADRRAARERQLQSEGQA